MRREPTKSRSTPATGFTLVELLLTISLVALILIEAGSVFSAASRAYRRVRADEEVSREADAAMTMIARDISRIAAAADSARPPVMAVASIDGEPAALLRLRTIEPAGSYRGDAVVDYFVATVPAGGRVLARRRESILETLGATRVGSTVGPSVTWEAAVTGVSRFVVRFYDGVAWIDQWDTGIPELIEVTLEIDRAGRRPLVMTRCVAVAGGGV